MSEHKNAGVEASAIGLLKEAVILDTERRFAEALVCYREGIQLLLTVVKVTSDVNKKEKFTGKIKEYMDRAEALKTYVEQEDLHAKVHEEIHIEDNSVGYSYEKIFSKCLDSYLTRVDVEDPYIRSHHQICNFLRFCELVVKSNAPVKVIHLHTSYAEDRDRQQQKSKFEEIGASLQKHNISLEIEYSSSLHDREIRFNNGWIVKIGRGLDYFKPAASKFSIGAFDYDLRPCHKTTINIFHSKYTKGS